MQGPREFSAFMAAPWMARFVRVVRALEDIRAVVVAWNAWEMQLCRWGSRKVADEAAQKGMVEWWNEPKRKAQIRRAHWGRLGRRRVFVCSCPGNVMMASTGMRMRMCEV